MPPQETLRPVAVIGAGLDLGAGRRGVDMGPSAIRYAGLQERIARLGRECVDWGDVGARGAAAAARGGRGGGGGRRAGPPPPPPPPPSPPPAGGGGRRSARPSRTATC